LQIKDPSELLFHFNPTKLIKHRCDDKNERETHVGDFGLLYPDVNGYAKVKIHAKRLNLNMIYGRPLVVMNKRACDQTEMYTNSS